MACVTTILYRLDTVQRDRLARISLAHSSATCTALPVDLVRANGEFTSNGVTDDNLRRFWVDTSHPSDFGQQLPLLPLKGETAIE